MGVTVGETVRRPNTSFNAVLRRMAADGTIKKVHAQALKEYKLLCD